MLSPWDLLPPPSGREYDEYPDFGIRYHKSDPQYCAYTYKELTTDIGIDFDFYKPIISKIYAQM